MSMNNRLTVRVARAEDRNAIRAVTLAAYAQYEQVMTPEYWVEYLEHVCEVLESDDGLFIVAEIDGRIVGSVRLVPSRPADDPRWQPGDQWPYMSILAVSPTARGKGVGGALLDECIRRARASGATALSLQTEEVMSAALQMYLRRGFVRAPEIDFFPGHGVHVMGFRYDLDDVGQEG